MPWKLVRAFLARGRPARLAACAVVAFAAVIWIALASVVLRVVFVLVLLLLVAWCAWLIYGIWTETDAPTWRALLPRVRWSYKRAAPEPAPLPTEDTTAAEDLQRRERELAEREAAFAVISDSLNAAIADLLRGQERLHANAERLQRELASQTEAMNALAAKLAHAELRPSTSEAPFDSEVDLRAAHLELEADLRLEKIEEQEQMLRDREEQLQRREHQLANFVAQTQSRLRPA
jgi:hypothetical protein